jgi:pimeloyl-ACP methyl ester carboxylesterase
VLRGLELARVYDRLIERFAAVARQHGAGRARRIWLEDSLLESVRRKPRAYERIVRIASDYTFNDLIRPAMERQPESPALQRLAALQAPALAVVGELDTADMRGMTAALLRGIPNARKTVIPEAGHYPQLEQPEAFNWVLGDFLRNRVRGEK